MEIFLNSRKQQNEANFKDSLFNEIFTEDELIFLQQGESFDDTESVIENSPQNKRYSFKINSFLFDRSKLILKLLKISKEKLNSDKEVILSKGLEWLTKEVQDSILFKSDEFSINKLTNLKKENKDLQTIFSWLEEYSTIKIRDGVTKIKLKDVLNDSNNLKINQIHKIPIEVFKSYFNNENKNNNSHNNEMKFINISEETILTIEEPNFDIFKLCKEVGQENILCIISCFIFTTKGFYSMIEYEKFEMFIQEISKGYIKENSYHNDLHAADVLQTVNILLNKGEIQNKLKLNDIDICAILISAIIHDFMHPGRTNLFLINSGSPLAIKYNDTSVLENFHVAQAFKIIKSNKQFDIFNLLSKEEYKIIRKRIIECVLATDMSFHAKQFTYLKLKIANHSITNGENIDKILEGLDNTGVYSTQQEFMNIIIHAADISNPTKPFEIYKNWAERVMEEFWVQGDNERELNMPISFLCDRTTTTLPGAQIGFMDGIVSPFINSLVQFFPQLNFLIENVNENKNMYKMIKQEEENKNKKVE